jgi:hypothetical protein
MKHSLSLFVLALLAVTRPLAAQDYVGDITPGSSVNLQTSLGSITPTVVSGSLDAEMTVNAQTPSIALDQVVANNVQLSNIVNTQYITTGLTAPTRSPPPSSSIPSAFRRPSRQEPFPRRLFLGRGV